MAVLLVTGFKNYVRLQYLMFTGTGVIVVIMLAQFLRTDPAHFAVAINHFNGIVDKNPAYYTWLQHDVSGAGFNITPKFALGATLLAAPIAWTSTQWATYSVEQGGEIKGARVFKNQMFIIVGSLIAVGIVLALIAWTEQRAVGTGFFNAASASYYGGVSTSGTGIGSVLPFPGVIAIVISPNPIITVLVGLRLHAGLAADHLQLLHRLHPHHGRHVARPHAAGVVLEGQLALPHPRQRPRRLLRSGRLWRIGYNYSRSGTPHPGRHLRRGYVFVFSCLAAALLPYRAKALYEAAPGASLKLLGIPLVTIFGLIGFVAGMGAEIAFVTKSGYGLKGTSPAYIVVPPSSPPAWSSTGSAAPTRRARASTSRMPSSRCRPSDLGSRRHDSARTNASAEPTGLGARSSKRGPEEHE